MRFSYEAAFGKSSANGYERLLLDAMSGDATRFSRGVRLGDRLRVRHADLDDVPGCARSTRGYDRSRMRIQASMRLLGYHASQLGT